MIRDHFKNFARLVNTSLPKVYGVQPVIEAVSSAVDLDIAYTGDRHELKFELEDIVDSASAWESARIQEIRKLQANCSALGQNYRKVLINSLYESCEKLTEDLCAFGFFGGDGGEESDFRNQLQDVMHTIETNFKDWR